jgi:hypothetical protein
VGLNECGPVGTVSFSIQDYKMFKLTEVQISKTFKLEKNTQISKMFNFENSSKKFGLKTCLKQKKVYI